MNRVLAGLVVAATILPVEPAWAGPQDDFNKAEEYSRAAQHGEAAKWYRKAAAQGLMEAQYKLGSLFDRGSGVPKNLTGAFIWYERAAQQGHAEAQFLIAKMYRDGKGVPRNADKALEWFTKSNAQGYPDARQAMKSLISAMASKKETPIATSQCYGQKRTLFNSTSVSVTFKNATGEAVRVFWRNFSGQPINFGIIDPGQSYEVNTYVTHPWFFVGEKSNECVTSYDPVREDNGKDVSIKYSARRDVQSSDIAPAQIGPGEVLTVQKALNREGYNAGKPDGKYGRKTAAAISQYQREWGLPITGKITDELITGLDVAKWTRRSNVQTFSDGGRYEGETR